MSSNPVEERRQLSCVYQLMKQQKWKLAFVGLMKMTFKHIGTDSYEVETYKWIASHIAAAWTVLLGGCPVRYFETMMRECVCRVQAQIQTIKDVRRQAACRLAFWFQSRIDVRAFLPVSDDNEKECRPPTTTCLAVARQLAACIRRRIVESPEVFRACRDPEQCLWTMTCKLALIRRMFMVGKDHIDCVCGQRFTKARTICRVCEEDYVKVHQFVQAHACEKSSNKRKRDEDAQPA